MPGKKKRRGLFKTMRLRNVYLHKTGFYKEVGKSFLRLGIIVILLFAAYWFIGTKWLDIDEMFNYLVHTVSKFYVFALFFTTETFLNIIPTDLYIIWSEELAHPWRCLTILSILSYLAGLTTYAMARLVRRIPRVNKWFTNRFEKHIKNSKKWGGYLIGVGAMTPLPYSITVFSMGLLKYPLKQFLLWSLLRIPRFYIYAYILYRTINLNF